MAKSNILHVGFRTEEQRDMLVDHYTYLGYYVRVDGERVIVSSIHPKKVKKEEEKKKSEDRTRRKVDKRDYLV